MGWTRNPKKIAGVSILFTSLFFFLVVDLILDKVPHSFLWAYFMAGFVAVVLIWLGSREVDMDKKRAAHVE